MLPANSHIQSANTSEINHDVQHTTSYYLFTSRKNSRISVLLSTPVLKRTTPHKRTNALVQVF